MKKTLIFIPAYNCQPQIGRVLRRLSEYHSYFQGILIIDNRSEDETLQEAVKTAKELGLINTTILINNKNVSLGGSHKVAFRFSLDNDYDRLIVLHGDDQADFGDIIPHLNKEIDCLLGARFHKNSKLIGYSKFRTFGNIVLNSVCSIVCRRKILDMGSGLNLYSKNFIQDERYLSFPNDLTFNVFLLFHSCFANYKLSFFPISWRDEDQISNARLFRQMKKILGLSLKTLLNKKLVYNSHSEGDYRYEVLYQA